MEIYFAYILGIITAVTAMGIVFILKINNTTNKNKKYLQDLEQHINYLEKKLYEEK